MFEIGQPHANNPELQPIYPDVAFWHVYCRYSREETGDVYV